MRSQDINNLLKECDELLKEQGVTPKVAANKGDVAEGILGATLAARFLYPEQELTGDLIFRLIQELNQGSDVSDKSSIIKQTSWERPGNPEVEGSESDTIGLKVGLTKKNFEGFVNHDFFTNQMSDIWTGAIQFASSGPVMSVVQQVYEDPSSNEVNIESVGTEDQRGTKVDLRVIVDGEPIDWGKISLKVGGVGQFGQIGGGWKGDPSKKRYVRGIYDLFEALFGIQLDSNLKDEYLSAVEQAKEDKDVDTLLPTISDIYANAYDKISKKFSGDEDELLEFLHTLANGLKREATLEEEDVILVDLGKGTFQAVDFNKLIDIIDNSDIDITVEYNAEGRVPHLFIEMAVDGKDYGQLVGVRPKARIDSKGKVVVRHYVEKKPGLEELISIADQ